MLAVPVGKEVRLYDRQSWKATHSLSDDHHKEVSSPLPLLPFLSHSLFLSLLLTHSPIPPGHQCSRMVSLWPLHSLRRCGWVCHCVGPHLQESLSKVRGHLKTSTINIEVLAGCNNFCPLIPSDMYRINTHGWQ